MLDVRPRILSVGTAAPPRRYRQEELLDLFQIHDPRIRSLFLGTHIETRHLYLPPQGPGGAFVEETQGQLLQKHLRGALELGATAIDAALAEAGLARSDIDALTCITTTGFLAPGLTAHLIRAMGLKASTTRADIVGMGCNAGLNGLNPVSAWAMANPGKVIVMACIEVCSAAYVMNGSIGTAVVNSLFGDGSAAIVVRAAPQDTPRFAPSILGFESHIIPEAIGAMRYDWDDHAGKFSFYLDRDIPYVVGAHAATPLRRLLAKAGLKQRQIRHWLVHSGGKKVVDAIKYNLDLSDHDVRHTHSVLRDYGNVSSASFLFSYQRLLAEGRARRGDLGVMMTMGPGSTIETALLRW